MFCQTPLVLCAACLTTLVLLGNATVTAGNAAVKFNVNDGDGKPVPCRIHLKDSNGKPQKAVGQPFWNDHFVCSGQVVVSVAPGEYSWEIERGPEHTRASGTVEVSAEGTATVATTLRRVTTLRDEGWYSGDLHVHRAVADVEQLMRAEDLDLAPVIEWWNARGGDLQEVKQTRFQFDGHRVYEVRAGEDEREGGALLYFGLNGPLDLRAKSREVPSPMRFVKSARQRNQNVWIDIEKPFWWDVPTWLASGQMNSIGLANNHMCRSGMYESEAWGRPRDVSRLPNPVGNGYWTQEIYYHALESGIRIPPSAGSASGVLPNPVGYNRVYVHLGDQTLTRDAWFDGLSQGRCFVTNGPLLRVTASGHLPGKVMKLPADGSITVNLTIALASNDPVSAVEVIHNGRTIKRLDCSSQVTQDLSTSFTINQTGWFLVRAIADVDNTFRFASTAPWYVETQDGTRRISKSSAQFFLDWVDERIERVEKNVQDAAERAAVFQPHVAAREFWANKVQIANANVDRDARRSVEETSARSIRTANN